MVAGLLDIRAERSFEWPQQQDIGELKLNFIRIQPKAPTFAVALINTVPVIVGLLLVSWIANNNLALPTFIATLSSGILADVGPAFTRLTTAPDFWLWFYLAFTIGNTMLPDVQRLKGWRVVIPVAGVVALVLVIAGAGNEFINNVMNGAVADSLNALASVLGAIIVLDVMGVAILGSIEALVERLTGNSATFKDNKMIVATRAEILQQREQAFQAERNKLNATTNRKAALPAPTHQTIYSFPFPIPGAPGKEPVRQEASVILPSSPTPQAAFPAREVPKVIPGTATESPMPTSSSLPAPARPAGGAPTPSFTSGVSPAKPAPASGSSPTSPSSPANNSPTTPTRPIGHESPVGENRSQPRPSFPALPTGTNRPTTIPAKPLTGDNDEPDEDEVRYVDLEDSP